MNLPNRATAAQPKQENFGGTLMSSSNGALRRLGLLAGSSLAAVSLSFVTFTGASLAPTPAAAYDECVPADGATQTDGPNGVSDPTLNGTTPDSFACAATTYPDDVTYDSNGNLAVGTTAADFVDVGAGVELSGNSTDSVAWDSAPSFLSANSSVGATIDVTSVSGDITINTGSVSAGYPDGTHAIRAASTGGGDITINSNGNLTAESPASTAIVEATTNGGNISITATTGSDFFDGHRGRLRGIVAETSGAGSISVGISGSLNTSAADGSLIETVAASGGTTINLASGMFGAGEFFGAPVLTHTERVVIRSVSTTGAVTVQNSGALMFGEVDFSGVTAGDVTFSNTGTGLWRTAGDSVFGGGNDTLNFSSSRPFITGNALAEGGSIDFGAGNDTINIMSSFEIGTSRNFGTDLGAAVGLGATLDFGSGADAINNSGTLGIDGPVLMTSLESFNNSGLLSLGPISPTTIDPTIGDLSSDDVLTMPGATFTGSGLSRILAAVHLDTSEQDSCAAPTGAGDCLYLPGGATAGSTLVTVLNAGDPATQGGFNGAGVTVVDVSGGTSASGHFSLDPNSQGYRVDPIYGGVIQRPGLFAYRLVYDPEAQRHMIVGLPRSEAMEYAALGSAAQSVWYMTSQAVTDRQTDLREGTEGSVWMKVSGEYTRRDIANDIGAYADTFTFDNSYKLYAGTIMGGMDFITGHSGGYDYVLGGQIGYVGSTFDLNASPSSGQMTGATGGVYGSIWNGALFLDGALNTNFLTLDYDAPGLGSKTTTWLRSVGAQLEGGRRFMLGEKLFAEPLATVAFVNTAFEEISLDGGEVTPDDASSQRAALGLRLGADMFGGPLKVRYFVTGRAWNEFGGENDLVVFNPGDDLRLAEDSSGSFGEAQAGLSLFNDDQTIAGFLTSGVKFKDGYNAVDLDLGLRLRW